MVQYGLTSENQNLIIEKAKTKSDGVFKFRGVAYRVRNNKVTHYAANGKILQGFGVFNVVLGNLEHMSTDYAAEQLRKIKD